MQQYQNPNFYTQYPQYQQPQYNPYMQRMENLQQFQQAINQPLQPAQMSIANQPFTPLGKIVESVDMVKATDIPMDGNMYYFPKADGTELYTKQWLPNGQTRILTYKPLFDDNPNNLSTEEEKLKIDVFTQVLGDIQNDIKTLNEKVDKLTKPSRSKKESVEDAE